MKTSYLLWGLYVLMDLATSDERNFRINFNEFAIKYKMPDIFAKVNCQLNQLNNRSYVNGEMVLKRDVGDLNVRATMEFWKPKAQNKIKLYDVRVDGCVLLRSIHQNKLFNLYVKSFKKHANVILTCPFKANYTYKMVDWYLDEQDLPPYVPAGRFRTITEYFTQNRLLVRFVARGEILAKS
ncbi:uncharacterized protein LOC108105811 [Drosophila eugracilis]|uniref:uncharacterized protein LOC108105811 n=1 Tax=Drosophila eugracilis TaxID=29029 RepID=UPI0007E6CDFC|nr:uncharacterized protein LOC108105811 [Drosophila eugracilis]